MKALLEHLCFVAQYLSETDLEAITSVILIDLGFPSKRDGFIYLVEAILRYKANPDQLFTWGLYSDIGKKHGKKTKMQVEICIRRELKKQWTQRNQDKWDLYFPQGITSREKGPSNAEFICAMVQVLKIWEGCYENWKKKCEEGQDEYASRS